MLNGWKANFWAKNMVLKNVSFIEFEYLVIPQPSPSWEKCKIQTQLLDV
jgi:hypothetical protein